MLRKGTNKEIDKKVFAYRINKIDKTIELRILLDHYYIDKMASGFDQQTTCSIGGLLLDIE